MENIENYKCFCGEAPIWKKDENKVYWVDTGEAFCYRMDITTKEVEKIATPGMMQALGKREKGGWIAQTPANILLLDKNLQLEKDLGRLLADDSGYLLNDGTVGPDGNYYVGYYDPENLTNKVGGVYRINQDYSFELVLEGYALPNGLAFSLDGTKLYFTEMFDNRIIEFDFDAVTGSFSNERTLVTVDEEEVYPDGLILDSEGYLWSGQWQGFRIVRYTPQGSIDKVIPVDQPTPTCLAILPDNQLFITTSIKGCSDEQLAEYPHCGECLLHSEDVQAAPEHFFKG